MRRRVTAALLLACLLVAVVAASAGTPATSARAKVPAGFFGIVPQTILTPQDGRYMKAGGIETVRLPLGWSGTQPTRRGGYDWTSFDNEVTMATSAGLRVLPFIASTPTWVTRKSTTLPIDSGRARKGWVAFVKAAVERYGPGGDFWTEHAPAVAGVNYVTPVPRPLPVRTWQIWNEANFFYSTYPASPTRYARLLKLTHKAIKSVDPRAKIVTAGLFGRPDERGKLAMPAVDFLERMYRVPGIKNSFDSIGIHPYAFHVDDLEEITEEVREVAVENRDPSAGLYITEMGWGSQNDPHLVAFEQGMRGQARELNGTYRYLIENRHRLNLKAAYWFSWKDLDGYCNFCDSVGFFHDGPRFRSKPAWRAFVALTGGRLRP